MCRLFDTGSFWSVFSENTRNVSFPHLNDHTDPQTTHLYTRDHPASCTWCLWWTWCDWLVVGSMFSWERAVMMGCWNVCFWARILHQNDTRACSWAISHSSRHHYIAHTPPLQPYATIRLLRCVCFTPLDHYDLHFLKKHEIRVFFTPTRPHTPLYNLFVHFWTLN